MNYHVHKCLHVLDAFFFITLFNLLRGLISLVLSCFLFLGCYSQSHFIFFWLVFANTGHLFEHSRFLFLYFASFLLFLLLLQRPIKTMHLMAVSYFGRDVVNEYERLLSFPNISPVTHQVN